jgi:hypothetical protein
MGIFNNFIKSKTLLDAIMSDDGKQVLKNLENGVDLNKCLEEGSGRCPVHYAACCHYQILKILLENKATVNVKDKTGDTPLHIASRIGFKEGVKLLLDYGAKTDVPNENGKTPLHLAAIKGYTDVVRQLIERGANVNAQDNFGHTPLLAAAAEVSIEEMDMARGFYFYSQEEFNQEQSNRESAGALLKTHGAVPSQADIKTATALGKIPEVERLRRHYKCALEDGDINYQNALDEITKKYPFLFDAYGILQYIVINKKRNLFESEICFFENFLNYESTIEYKK